MAKLTQDTVLLVLGQRPNGPVLQRLVTVREFIAIWGRWAGHLLAAATRETVTIEGHSVRVLVTHG